jgi:signal transduction histidine kinase
MNNFSANAVFDKRIAIALALVAAVALLLVNEGAYWQSKNAMDTLVNMGSSRIAIQRLTENLINAESAQRGFALTGKESLLNDLGKANSAIKESFAQLAQGHATQPSFMAALALARARIEARLALVSRGVALRRDGKLDEAITLVMQNDSTMELVQSLDNELLALEDVSREQRRETVYRSLLIARVGIAALIALGLAILLQYMRQARALSQHQEQLKTIEQTKHTDLQAQVALRTAELTDLTRYLLINREDERSRLARNLHDDLGGLLTSAKLDVARIKTRMAKSAPDSLELLAHLVTTLNDCVALGRNIIENLRPSALDNLGLVATLEILAREFGENSGIDTQCALEPVTLSASAELMVYRVVQEALTNIARYASARRVTISLRIRQGHPNQHPNRQMHPQMELSVRDNGRGFDTTQKPGAAYGLLGMRYRVEAEGGTLSVISAPGAGTQVLVTLTLP